MSKLDTPVIELVELTTKLTTPLIRLVEESTALVDWSTTVPERAEGQYIWQRVKYIHADGSVSYNAPVCITGDKGNDGKNGQDGKDGTNGKDGKDGQQGEKGDKGDKGDTGDAGKDGKDGLDGKDGKDGKDAITYQIDSSLGTQFLEGNEQYTTLTARVFKGSTELDTADAYGYEWYLVKDGAEPLHIGNGKTISLLTTTLGGNGIYFVADDGGVVEELPQLDAPSIQLVEVFNKLDTPIIKLEETNLGKLEKPNIELKEE